MCVSQTHICTFFHPFAHFYSYTLSQHICTFTFFHNPFAHICTLSFFHAISPICTLFHSFAYYHPFAHSFTHFHIFTHICTFAHFYSFTLSQQMNKEKTEQNFVGQWKRCFFRHSGRMTNYLLSLRFKYTCTSVFKYWIRCKRYNLLIAHIIRFVL